MAGYSGSSRYRSPLAKVGLIGGGQLGLMLGEAAAAMDVAIHILDPAEEPPALRVAVRHVRGELGDPSAIAELARGCDVISYEIERGDPGTLRRLGIPVEPAPATLEIIQDKLVQRRHLARGSVPMPRFAALENACSGNGTDLQTIAGQLRTFGFPLVQKARRGGYDGRGVMVHRREPEDGGIPDGPIPWDDGSYIEAAIEIVHELAVIVARSTTGETAVYDPVEMHFDDTLNLVDAVIYPAGVSAEVAGRAREVALDAVALLPGAGVFAVELFVDSEGTVLVNEIAPRPHNSGHITIEAAETSQYEQHIRGILGLPLGDTSFRSAGVMRNILGGPVSGPTVYTGIAGALAVPDVHLHLYGKRESRPGRKMGHLTATGADAWERAEIAWRRIGVNGC
ncbi:MAG: 5-(carboxyamino)imidazole ribonucleotide synthase [Alkalispirochaeta sp.]